MKSTVNLYQSPLRPTVEAFTLAQLLKTTTVVMVCVASAVSVVSVQTASVKQAQQQLDLELQTVTNELTVFQQTLAERKPDVLLEQRLAELQTSNSQKQSLLQYLQADSLKPVPDYFSAMQHLENIDERGLWLNQFTLAPQQIEFQGMTRDGKLVATWLQRLGNDPFFQGKSFETIQLKPADRGVLSFVITADPASKVPKP